MFQIPTLYKNYQELLLDLDILGKILSESLVNKDELRDLLFDEYKITHPLPTLEDKRYELSDLVSSDYHISYASEIELAENEHLVDLEETEDTDFIFEDNIVVPDSIKEYCGYGSVTDAVREDIIKRFLTNDIEEFEQEGIEQLEGVFNTVESHAVVYEEDEDEYEEEVIDNLESDADDDDDDSYFFSSDDSEDDDSTEDDDSEDDDSTEDDDSEDDDSYFFSSDDSESESEDDEDDDSYFFSSDDSEDDDSEDDDSEDDDGYFFSSDDSEDDDSESDDDSEDDGDSYFFSSGDSESEDEDDEDDGDSYFFSSDDSEDDDNTDTSSNDDSVDEYEDDEDDDGYFFSSDDSEDDEGDSQSVDSTEDDEDDDSYFFSSSDDEEDDSSSVEDNDNDNYSFSSKDSGIEDSYSLPDDDFIIIDDVQPKETDEVITPVPTPVEIINKNKKNYEQVVEQPKIGVNRESEPKDLREFIRKHPRCEVSFALQYFSRKEIEKYIMLGKVIKKGTKLHI